MNTYMDYTPCVPSLYVDKILAPPPVSPPNLENLTTAMSRDAREVRPPRAALIHLDRPEKLDKLLKQDKLDDCLSCRLMGTTTLIGLGAYSYLSGKHHLQRREAAILKSRSRFGIKSRQIGVTAIAISFVGLGLWRLLN